MSPLAWRRLRRIVVSAVGRIPELLPFAGYVQPSFSWISIVVAGAVRSVGHIIDYRKKKKAKKEAKKEHAKEALAQKAPDAESLAASNLSINASNKHASAPSSVTPFLAIGAVIVGVLLLKKR